MVWSATCFRHPPFVVRACLVLALCVSLVYLVVLDDSALRPPGDPADARALNSAADKQRRLRSSSGSGSGSGSRPQLGTLPQLTIQQDVDGGGDTTGAATTTTTTTTMAAAAAATTTMTTRALYSIWLEPPAGSPTSVKSAAFIKSQAARMPGPPPVFDPHVTLVGGFEGTEEEVRNKSTQLAADLGAESGPLFWGAECEVDEVGIGGAGCKL